MSIAVEDNELWLGSVACVATLLLAVKYKTVQVRHHLVNTDWQHTERLELPPSTSRLRFCARASCPLSISPHSSTLKVPVLCGHSIAAHPWSYLWRLETNCDRDWWLGLLKLRNRAQVTSLGAGSQFYFFWCCQAVHMSNTRTWNSYWTQPYTKYSQVIMDT